MNRLFVLWICMLRFSLRLIEKGPTKNAFLTVPGIGMCVSKSKCSVCLAHGMCIFKVTGMNFQKIIQSVL